MDIKTALDEYLSAANDEHWTADGMPKVDVVSEVVGESLTRKQITEVAPHFTRSNPFFDHTETQDDDGKLSDPVVEDEVDEELEAAQIDLEAKQDALNEAAKVAGEAQIALKLAEAEEMAARKLVSDLTPEDPTMSEIQRYFKAQDAQRAERAQKAADLKEKLGVDLSVTEAAAIDKAFARKTGHGRNRPVRPTKQEA